MPSPSSDAVVARFVCVELTIGIVFGLLVTWPESATSYTVSILRHFKV